MNFKDDYRNLLKERIATSDEAITFDEPFIKETVKLFADNIPDAISFLKNDCTEDEYSWISEIIDDIAEKSKSVKSGFPVQYSGAPGLKIRSLRFENPNSPVWHSGVPGSFFPTAIRG